MTKYRRKPTQREAPFECEAWQYLGQIRAGPTWVRAALISDKLRQGPHGETYVEDDIPEPLKPGDYLVLYDNKFIAAHSKEAFEGAYDKV